MDKFTKNRFIENGYISATKKHENTFVDTHFHDFFELEFIISGSGSYIIDGTAYDIEAGDLFFLTPLNFHTVEISNAELYNVMFSGNICSGTFLKNLTKNAPVALKTNGHTRQFFEVILDELCHNSDNTDLAITMLNAIIAKLESEISHNEKKNTLTSIGKAELYILNNFRNELTLEDAAREAALAPTYFSRRFKTETGTNFKTYLNNMRFEYAKRLLEHTDMTVMQICSECGWNDYPNFIRRFRQNTGLYPAQYRKLSKQ